MFADSASVGVESDVYIGPMSVSYEATNRGAINSHWTTDGAAIDTHTGGVFSANPLTMNSNATYTVEFVIPKDRSLWDDRNYQEPLFSRATSLGIGIAHIYAPDAPPFLTFRNGASAHFDLTKELLKPGYHVWTFVADHTNGKVAWYADGVLIQEQSQTVSTNSGSSILEIGKYNLMSGASFYFLSFREDAVALSADDIIAAQVSLAQNTVARGTADLAKGRWYEIVTVPQTPLIQEGDSIWMGDIKLRQVEYVGGAVWYADEEGAL